MATKGAYLGGQRVGNLSATPDLQEGEVGKDGEKGEEGKEDEEEGKEEEFKNQGPMIWSTILD